MTTAPWSGPRILRGRTLPRPTVAAPARLGQRVRGATVTGARTARGYVSSCSHRAFAVLCALLVLAAMATSLVFNTARGEGAFRLAEVQASHRHAEETRLGLEAQVAQMESPERIADRAEDLGMVPAGQVGYVDPASGTVTGEAAPASAPGDAKDQKGD